MSTKKLGCYGKKLSKNLLQMKFMRKSKDKLEIDELAANKQALLDKELAKSMRKFGCQYIIEASYGPCEDLRFGRMSFNGANPEIEKIMNKMKAAKMIGKKKTQSKDGESDIEVQKSSCEAENGTIGEEEMAERYSTLINTMGKKLLKKRGRCTQSANRAQGSKVAPGTPAEPPAKKKKFLKPRD